MTIRSQKLYFYLFVFLYWIFSINIISVIGIFSIKSFLTHANFDVGNLNDPIALYWVSPAQFLESFLLSFFLSILFIGVHELSDLLRWDKFSFGKIIIIKSSVYLVGLIVINVLIYTIIVIVGTFPGEDLSSIPWNLEIILLIILFGFYILFLLLLLNFIVQTTMKIGNYNLISFLTGKYHTPVNEDRIFLFLDLTSSTSYAEKLGSNKYSMLIKDCFDDLNFIVNRFEAEIYQYVGDEIVLTWKTPEGLKNYNFINVFFAFEAELNRRKDYYTENYGLIPQFKAGINGGIVSVAEVGNIKREIAFHGDVINTTSRIEGVCNQFSKKLLVSGQVVDMMNGSTVYKVEFLGDHLLRGKAEKVALYSVDKLVRE